MKETNCRSQANWAPHLGRLTLHVYISSVGPQLALGFLQPLPSLWTKPVALLSPAAVTDEWSSRLTASGFLFLPSSWFTWNSCQKRLLEVSSES